LWRGQVGMTISDEMLAQIKRLHHANALTLDQIGERFGLTGGAISKLARANGWPARDRSKGHAAHRFRFGERERNELVHQLYSTTLQILEQMEAEMASGKPGTQDVERAAKAVAAMIGSVGKMTMAGRDGNKTHKPKSSGADEDRSDAASRVERLQREIIERFEGIQRRRNAEAGSE
jgi:hypothetical protein